MTSIVLLSFCFNIHHDTYRNINIIVSSLIIKSNVPINLFSSKFKNTFSIFSASLIDEFVPGQMITGTGADKNEKNILEFR